LICHKIYPPLASIEPDSVYQLSHNSTSFSSGDISNVGSVTDWMSSGVSPG
jgi:hypothetical protein